MGRKRKVQSPPEMTTVAPVQATEPGQPVLGVGTPQPTNPKIAKAEADRVARERFLVSLRAGNTVKQAALDSGVSRITVFRWRESNDQFGKDWTDALKEGDEAVIQEIHRRAIEGVDKPVFQGGVEVGRIRQYSDVLLIVYAKMRGIFQENAVIQHQGKVEVIDARAELLQILEDRSKIKAPVVIDVPKH